MTACNAECVRDLISRLQGVEKKVDSTQTKLYIVAGVCGAATLVIIILVIALVIQLKSLRERAMHLTSGNPIPKTKASPDNNTKSFPRTPTGNYGGQNGHHQQPVPHSYAQPPRSIMSAEEELAHLGFSAYTGDTRGLSPAAISTSTAGGVRVLPRNPPTGFRHNTGFNDDFM